MRWPRWVAGEGRRTVRARDELRKRHKALLEGSYDCVDRVVLNAYMAPCHSPGGSRAWWRLWHEGSDAQLDDTHLIRLAGGSRGGCGPGGRPTACRSSTARPENGST